MSRAPLPVCKTAANSILSRGGVVLRFFSATCDLCMADRRCRLRIARDAGRPRPFPPCGSRRRLTAAVTPRTCGPTRGVAGGPPLRATLPRHSPLQDTACRADWGRRSPGRSRPVVLGAPSHPRRLDDARSGNVPAAQRRPVATTAPRTLSRRSTDLRSAVPDGGPRRASLSARSGGTSAGSALGHLTSHALFNMAARFP